MNIFCVDACPVKSAKSLGNKHVLKMIVESAQLLSTAIRVVDPNKTYDGLYKRTHHNHPCSIWLRKSKQNFQWLHRHGVALLDEYLYRYYKYHKSSTVISLAGTYADLFPDIGLTKFALAMPNEYKVSDPVESYRNYYRGAKKDLLVYTRREPPHWVSDIAERK
jgi:hypothetical protein